MRFFLHGHLGSGVAQQFVEQGHVALMPGDVVLAEGGEREGVEAVFEAARKQQFEVVTGDAGFLQAALPGSGHKGRFGRVIVYLKDEPADHALAVMRLFERYKRLTPGRLYTVTAGRVKIRQLPQNLD